MSEENSILFLSYWYPNKINRIFPVFIKKHAQAISQQNKIIVLSLSIIYEPVLFKKSVEVISDENGIETHQVYLSSRFYKFLYVCLPLHYIILRKYIKCNLVTKYSFNIFHSNILFPCAIVGSWLAGYFGLKHVITEHWSKLDTFFRSNFYKSHGKNALMKADAITCVSQLLNATLKKYTENKNIKIVPNVIDENEYFLDNDSQQKSVFTFIAAANWTPPKNPFYFLEALNELQKENKIGPFELIMAGNGSQLEEVKKKEYKFKIIYPGILNSKELKTALNQAHVFLHGSDYETFSTVIAEALMCGLPAVVSPVGIALEVIDSENGFVTNNSHDDWVAKIQRVLSGDYDRKKIATKLKNKYDVKTVGQDFTSIYKNLH